MAWADRRVRELRLGFLGLGTQPDPVGRLESSLFVEAVESRWQLLHVVAMFWNNHFHTRLGTLRQNFFAFPPRAGTSNRATREIFQAVDTDRSGGISQPEWTDFYRRYPAAIRWVDFGAVRSDGVVTEAEFLGGFTSAWWKYRNGRDQLAACADVERREYEYFRRHAFGQFSQLLEGSAKSVAMVIYLNSFENTVEAPNENYAREFLELYSLGADHLYTQRDIEELARVLTGWSVTWVERSRYEEDDTLFIGHPEARAVPLGRRHPVPINLPTAEFWDDDLYVWGFTFGRDPSGSVRSGYGHDWGTQRPVPRALRWGRFSRASDLC